MSNDRVEWAEAIERHLGSAWQPPPDCTQDEHTIEGVESDDRGWGITYDGSSHVYLKRELVPNTILYGVDDDDEAGDDETWAPKVGDQMIVYFTNWTQFIGFVINGEPIYLKSEREINLEWLLMRAKMARERRESFERAKDKLDADYEALPQVFKDRIDRFRHNNESFREEFESYEMFCCTEAVKLAEAARKGVDEGLYADEVDAFWSDPEKLKLAAYPDGDPWQEPDNKYLRWLFWARALHSKAFDYDHDRHKAVTGMSDGHSGNTAGAAMMLARLYIESPEYVSQLHGALSPLVGSEAYGDIDPETNEVG